MRISDWSSDVCPSDLQGDDDLSTAGFRGVIAAEPVPPQEGQEQATLQQPGIGQRIYKVIEGRVESGILVQQPDQMDVHSIQGRLHGRVSRCQAGASPPLPAVFASSQGLLVTKRASYVSIRRS